MKFLIALGSNVAVEGETPRDLVARAIDAVSDAGMEVTAQSAFYQTPCFPAGVGPDYINAAASLQSPLTPLQVLARLHTVEAAFGRERAQRWGNRVLDLDLLAWGDAVMPDPETHRHWRDLPAHQQRVRAPDELILPHPRLQDRAFVLVPLAEIAPEWRHPLLGHTAREMRDALPAADLAAITRL